MATHGVDSIGENKVIRGNTKQIIFLFLNRKVLILKPSVLVCRVVIPNEME